MSTLEYLATLKAGLLGQHGSVGLYSALQRCFVAFGLAAAPTCWLIGKLALRMLNVVIVGGLTP